MSEGSSSTWGSSVLPTCDASGAENCGWIAAVISAIAFGSFAVPIKGEAANSVNIDPLVMQTYKTTMCFLTSWFVLLLKGHHDFMFTPWGIVSGCFWVPGGTMAIFAVRNAGLAVSQGTWSSMIVAVSFVWGIFVFGEGVKSEIFATLAVGIMIIGLFGMSYYSSPRERANDFNSEEDHQDGARDGDCCDSFFVYNELSSEEPKSDIVEIKSSPTALEGVMSSSPGECGLHDNASQLVHSDEDHISNESNCTEHSPSSSTGREKDWESTKYDLTEDFVIFGKIISRRTAGLISAVMCGIWGGSIMVPMHFAPDGTSGLEYVMSFAIGSAIVNLCLWLLRLFYNVGKHQNVVSGWQALPPFHFRVMWKPGMVAGTVWSIGNIASILSVEFLGEGVGYSVVQSAMLISGLWGILWFHEIRGDMISKWMMAASITVFSILLLSYEHQASVAP